jgi:hypothetical protein
MYGSMFSRPRHWLELSGQLHAPATFPPGKKPPVPFGIRLGGTKNWSGRYEEMKILDPTGTRTPTPWFSSP